MESFVIWLVLILILLAAYFCYLYISGRREKMLREILIAAVASAAAAVLLDHICHLIFSVWLTDPAIFNNLSFAYELIAALIYGLSWVLLTWGASFVIHFFIRVKTGGPL